MAWLDYSELILFALICGGTLLVIALGGRALQRPIPSSSAHARSLRQLKGWGILGRGDVADSEQLDELAADLARMRGRLLLCIGVSVALACVIGIATFLASGTSLVRIDIVVLNAVVGLLVLGLFAGLTGGVLAQPPRDAPETEPSIGRARPPLWLPPVLIVAPSLVIALVVVTITAARMLGWLSIYRAASPNFAAARAHPWLLWILPLCIALVVVCQVLVILRLRSVPRFAPDGFALAQDAGKRWRSQLLAGVGISNMSLGVVTMLQVNPLQLDNVALSEGLPLGFLAIGVLGFVWSIALLQRWRLA